MNSPRRLAALILAAGSCAWAWAADPLVSNVRAAQREGTPLVEITYDATDADSSTLTVSLAVSDNGGASYTVPASSFSGDVGAAVAPGSGKRIVWDAGKDWPDRFSANMRFQVTAQDAPLVPSGMVLIPAGTFQMGDSSGEGQSRERPVHAVTVSGFYMDRTEMTTALWYEVRTWALANGYSFDNAGSGKAANHPVRAVNWYDVVKWCNARSEKEGRVPAYYTDAGLTAVYKTGHAAPHVRWDRGGYRLPTEAEWEKAARGGLSGRRFPWGDTISHSQANYNSESTEKPYLPYDVSPTDSFHPTYSSGAWPYTSPVGSFQPNGYGLYDMAGNVSEWCWDWRGDYGSGSQLDPRGPSEGSDRVIRGGSWHHNSWGCRVTYRANATAPDWPGDWGSNVGFRSVLPTGE